MPTYEYACQKCAHRFEKLQSINDMKTWKLKMEVQGLIDELKRAKEED